MFVAENPSQLVGSANIGEPIVSIIMLRAKRSWGLIYWVGPARIIGLHNRKREDDQLVVGGTEIKPASCFSEVA